jgi:hypothetical protein
MSVVITQSIVHVHLVSKVDDCVSSHVCGFLFAAGPTFQPQRRPQAPVRLEVFLDLAVDGANRVLDFFVDNPAISLIDDRNDHNLTPMFQRDTAAVKEENSPVE